MGLRQTNSIVPCLVILNSKTSPILLKQNSNIKGIVVNSQEHVRYPNMRMTHLWLLMVYLIPYSQHLSRLNFSLTFSIKKINSWKTNKYVDWIKRMLRSITLCKIRARKYPEHYLFHNDQEINSTHKNILMLAQVNHGCGRNRTAWRKPTCPSKRLPTSSLSLFISLLNPDRETIFF